MAAVAALLLACTHAAITPARAQEANQPPAQAISAANPAEIPGGNARQKAARAFAAARLTPPVASAPGQTAGTPIAPAAALQRARAQALWLGSEPRSSNFTGAWQPLGPSVVATSLYGSVTGRITAIAPDPNDASGNTVYLGTTGGGVWKSTNAAGAAAAMTWQPLTDTLPVFSQSTSLPVIPSLSIGAVAVQPVTPGVVLAGTGDPNDATDSLYGEGILRSADGGLTWTLISQSNDGVNGLHPFSGLSVAGIAFSTSSPQTVVAAFSTSAEAALVGANSGYSLPGLYVSRDAGVTWQMATVYDGASVLQTAQPLGHGQGYAATSVVWDALRGSFYAALRGHGYYASSDGITWTRLTAQPGTNLSLAACPTVTSAGCPLFRGTIAVQPVTGDLYALTVDANLLDQGIWQDLCNANGSGCANSAPQFATRIDGSALETGNGNTAIPQGDYNLALAVVPTAANGTLLLAGTVDVWRCSLAARATSCTWRNTTNAANGCTTPAGVAPAQHALASMAQSSVSPVVFAGNDGGLWRSTDGIAETGSTCAASDASHWENLNAAVGAGGSLSEVVGLAQSPTDANTLLVGLGANGSAATSTASSSAAWVQLSAGEGSFVAIDPNTPIDWYAAIGAGVNVKQCTAGSACASAAQFAGAPTVGEAQVANDRAPLHAAALLDPQATGEILTATCRVWRGPAGAGALWSASNAISAAMDGSATPCTAASAQIRSLGAGGPLSGSVNAQNAGSQVLYAGMAGVLDGGGNAIGGHIFRTLSAQTASAATTWTDIARSTVTNDLADNGVFNPGGYDISSVVVDLHDATGATVYATVMGFGGPTATPRVYRSTDFGAHWTSVTANLPAAPVNALVVDPNDANTVYVATDAGVYATQTITACASADCWNALGTGLPNAPVTTLLAGAALPVSGASSTGLLRAGTYGRGVWQIPLLVTTSVVAQPAMTLAPTALTFASQQVSTASAAQTITVTSTGTGPLSISTLSITGDFTESDSCAGQTLAVNATCTVSIRFGPTATGARTGLLTVYANVSGGQATVALNGTATSAPAASIVLTPASLSFAATAVNATSSAQIITVANTGTAAATLQPPVLTGDFSVTASTCGTSLAANTACSLSLTFTPTASGTRTGSLAITDSAGTQTASLTGTGSAPATDTLSPAGLSFAQTTVGATSGALQVTLTNAGDSALLLVSAASSSTEFGVVSSCGTSLAGHASCAISVTFTPAAVGTRAATLTVSDQFRTQTVALSGVAVAGPGVSLSPQALSFGSTGVGLTAPAQTLTLTNNGGVDLALGKVAASADFALASTTCGSTLSPGAACTLSVVFAPSAAGARAGALTLSDNASGGGTQTVALSGTGVDFSFAANGSTSASISGTSGSATFPLLLSSAPGVTSSVALSCSGAPAHATCTVTPSSSTLGASITVSAVVETGVATASLSGRHRAAPWVAETMAAFACSLPLLALRRRRKMPLLAMLLAVALVGGSAGCGSGKMIATDTGTSTPATTPTPAGTYNLTVTASSAGVTHTVPLTLVVQ